MVLFRTINLKTDLSQSEVLRLLESKTMAEKTKNADNIFVGYISDNTFQLKRDIQYTNSFLPVATGYVESTSNGAHIVAKLSLLLPTMIFLLIWYGMLTIITISILLQVGLSLSLLLPILLGSIGFALIRFGFNPEAETIEMAFIQILKARPVIN